MLIERPTIPINAQVALGISVIGTFAATILPVWAQALLFVLGASIFTIGIARAAWRHRFRLENNMIGSTLMLVVGTIVMFGGGFVSWLGIQGLKNITRPQNQAIVAATLTPQTFAQAMVDAFYIIRSRETEHNTQPVAATPAAKPKLTRNTKPKTRKTALAAPVTESSAALPAPITTPAQGQPIIPSQPAMDRHLNTSQQRALLQALYPLSSDISSSIILYSDNDPEGFSLASDVQKVFLRAGLQPKFGTESPHSSKETGLLLIIGRNTSKDVISRAKLAFERAGINIGTVRRDVDMQAPLIVFVAPNPL